MCIAALVVVVVLGIYHIHLTHQQEIKLEETAKEEGTSWDNSALKITVNPMEVCEKKSLNVTTRAISSSFTRYRTSLFLCFKPPGMFLTTESARPSGRRGGGQ